MGQDLGDSFCLGAPFPADISAPSLLLPREQGPFFRFVVSKGMCLRSEIGISKNDFFGAITFALIDFRVTYSCMFQSLNISFILSSLSQVFRGNDVVSPFCGKESCSLLLRMFTKR